jgi:hypothetical protein
MNDFHLQSRPGTRTYMVAACFTAAFLAPGIYVYLKQSEIWLILAAVAVMGFVFLNVSQIRLECDETKISYRSLLKNLHISMVDIMGVRIGRIGDSGPRAPKFLVQTRTEGEILLEVRALPLPDVQRLAAFLREQNVPFTVDPEPMAERMAAQILGST